MTIRRFGCLTLTVGCGSICCAGEEMMPIGAAVFVLLGVVYLMLLAGSLGRPADD